MRHLLCLLALACVLPTSAQKAPAPKAKKTQPTVAKARPKAATAAEPVLVFQRTPCFGRCPAYTASIFADGRVEYDGLRAVALTGKHTLALPVATVNQLLAEARRLHFAELQNAYKGNTTDLPSTIITVHPVGRPLKTVVAEEGIPQNLQEYINYLKAKIDPFAQNVREE